MTNFFANVNWHCESSKTYVAVYAQNACIAIAVVLFPSHVGGTYGSQSANEYCFTLSDAVVVASADFNPKYVVCVIYRVLSLYLQITMFSYLLQHSDTMNYTYDDQQQFLADKLQGEFCYVQTSDGKIVSVHYGTTENHEAINIKRSIASTFQANFDNANFDVEEADASSVHTSHYRYTASNIFCKSYMLVCW